LYFSNISGSKETSTPITTQSRFGGRSAGGGGVDGQTGNSQENHLDKKKGTMVKKVPHDKFLDLYRIVTGRTENSYSNVIVADEEIDDDPSNPTLGEMAKKKPR